MNKQTGSILLVAGTCIGSGMIALPMVLAKLGLIPSLFLMLLTWLLMYYTSLINLELNLQAGKGMSLGSLGAHFSGPIAGFVGNVALKLLSYALLAVFLYGAASIIGKMTLNRASLFEIEKEELESKMETFDGTLRELYDLIKATYNFRTKQKRKGRPKKI